MNKVRKTRDAMHSERPRQLGELLEQAAKQPGVKEVVEVYQNWQTFERAAQPHREIMAIRRIIMASNTSAPAFPPNG